MSLNRRYIATLILAAIPMALILLMSLSATETHAARAVFEYDHLGRLATVTNSGGSESTYTYDPVGNIMSTDGVDKHIGVRSCNATFLLFLKRNPLT